MSSSSYLSYLDLYINQGETFSVTITVSGMLEESYNLSSYTAKSDIKRSPWSNNKTTSFQTTIIDNAITLSLPSANTQLLTNSKYVYDMFVTNSVSNVTSKLIEGVIYVSPKITT